MPAPIYTDPSSTPITPARTGQSSGMIDPNTGARTFNSGNGIPLISQSGTTLNRPRTVAAGSDMMPSMPGARSGAITGILPSPARPAPIYAGSATVNAGLPSIDPAGYRTNSAFMPSEAPPAAPESGADYFAHQRQSVIANARQDNWTKRYAAALNKGSIELPDQAPATRIASQAGTSSGMSEQDLRQMWAVINQYNPMMSDEDKRQQFRETAARWGADGAALIHKWGGNGTLHTYQFPTGETTTTPSAPLDIGALDKSGNLGPASGVAPQYGFSDDRPHSVVMPNGDVIITDASGRQVGRPVDHQAPLMPTETPVMGPEQGFTPLSGSEVLGDRPRRLMPSLSPNPQSSSGGAAPTTLPSLSPNPQSSAPLDRNDQTLQRMYDLRDQATTPIPQADADRANRNRLIMLRNQGAAELASLGPSPREQFDGAVNVAGQVANAPVMAAQTRAEGNQAVAQTQAQGRVDAAAARGGSGGVTANVRPADRVAAFKATENLRVPDEKNPGRFRKMTTAERRAEADRMLSGSSGNPPSGTGGDLKPVPRNISDKYYQDAGGDLDKMRSNLRADGYDPDNVIVGQ